MARLVALRYGGESESVPGCLCNGTGTLHRLFSVTRPNPQSNAHAQGKPLFSEDMPWARALLWEMQSRQRFLCGEISTNPEQRRPNSFICFFFHFFEILTSFIRIKHRTRANDLLFYRL